MTVTAIDGPYITIGAEAAMGTANQTTGVAGLAPYISGVTENPDAGPNAFFAGNMFKDMRYRYNRGGGSLAAGGYANQAVGYVDHYLQTIDFVPSTIATANIAALAAPTSGVAMTLVAATGAGITVTTASFFVLPTGLTVPTAQRRIDANPTWPSVSVSSSAMLAWGRAAVGRAVSLTSAANLSAINFTVRGYDVYGVAITETITGPNANTVNGKKGFKWITSVTPSATSASTVSVGTADIFEFPIRSDKFATVDLIWNNARITANTGYVAADTTTATATTGATRGTYATQTASDGTKALQVFQTIAPANLLTAPGVFGVTQFA